MYISKRHFDRMKETSEQLETVMKILNGSGSLSTNLIEDATKIFPKAKLLSAYGVFDDLSSKFR